MFVANRVQYIRDHTKADQWQYISTQSNPADHASRGLTAAELLTSNWFTGPEFLWDVNGVQKSPVEVALMVGDPEVKAQVLSVQSKGSDDMLERLYKYSDWNVLIRIVARIRRIVHSKPEVRCLAVDELYQSGLLVISLVQRTVFEHEWKALSKGQDITCKSKLQSLNPYIADNVIRVGGRLRNSSLSMNQKHPVLLPRDGHITQLIIAHCHKEISHQGRGQTLNAVRNKGYWIIGGSRSVAAFIYRCVQCRKLRRPVEEQKMADLPWDRIEPSPPFTYVGMDCFGPLLVRKGRSEVKRYGLLLTCLCSRAVHIEVLDDMTTDALINGLRCFIAIRGVVRHIRCDQGSNFIGAKNELDSSMTEVQTDRIASYLLERQCDFIFNVPCSSHVGGVWERQIKTIKNVLNSTLAMCPGRMVTHPSEHFFMRLWQL